MIKLQLGVIPFLEIRSDGTDHAIRQENPEEGSDQRCRHFFPDHFRRTANRAHRDDHAQNGGHDPQPGQCVGYDGERTGGPGDFVVVSVDVVFEQDIQIVRRHYTRHRGTQGAANKIKEMVILNEIGKLREKSTFVGLLDILFEFRHAALARELKDVAQQFQAFEVVVPREAAALQKAHQAAEYLEDQGKRIGDEMRKPAITDAKTNTMPIIENIA